MYTNKASCVQEVIDDEKQAMDVDENALEGQPDEESDFIFGLNTILNLTRPNVSVHQTRFLQRWYWN